MLTVYAKLFKRDGWPESSPKLKPKHLDCPMAVGWSKGHKPLLPSYIRRNSAQLKTQTTLHLRYWLSRCWLLSPDLQWVGRCRGGNWIPRLWCPVTTAQTLASNDNSTRWQRPFPGYCSFLWYSGRTWQHVIQTVFRQVTCLMMLSDEAIDKLNVMFNVT